MFCMGIMVDPRFRRQGVAKFLTEKRFEWLRSINVLETFSAVAMDNQTSIRMHRSFGFEEIRRIPGVLTINFDCGEGILFKKVL